ncbi:MAG: hypothetical protein JO222_06380 [Frankiales bacterium]|nr:hypothetical protein [Frankiales bacterium]
MLRRRGDDGQLTVLVIGFTLVAALLVIVGIDASKVFLARRALASAADAAALAAAQSIDKSAVYSGDIGSCGDPLPLDPAAAEFRAAASFADDAPGLRSDFAHLDPPATSVDAGTATVRLSGTVSVPFGGALAYLLPGHGDGAVHITATSSAQSPIVRAAGC